LRKITSIGPGEWNADIEVVSLNQAAPFHVVEEERLRIPATVQRDRTADIESPKIETQLRDLIMGAVGVVLRIEVIACVKGIVAPKPPCRCVEVSRTGFDDCRDGCRR